MKKDNKGVLILIIVLLIIFSALAIWGGVGAYLGVNKEPEPENVNREFKFNNKLYFYDILNLVGTYDCKSSQCDYATSLVDDTNFSVNYYNDESEKQTSFISKRYAFITDGGNDIILYDVVNSSVVNRFKAVKNYGIGINDNYYILKDLNDKWGVMKIDSTAGLVIDYKYEYIGLHNKLKEGSTTLDNEVFVVKDVNGWKLISNTDVDKSTYFVNQIYDYNDKFIITKNGNYYYLNSIASGNLLISNLFLSANFIGEYIAVLSSTKEFYIINPNTLQEVSQKYAVNSIDEVKLEETLNGISISIGGVLKEVVK